MPVLPLQTLRDRLAFFEGKLAENQPVRLADVRALEAPSLQWAAQSPQGHPVPRLVRILRKLNAISAARDVLLQAHALIPGDVPITLQLANTLADLGEFRRAAEVLEPFTTAHNCDTAMLTRAAELNWQQGRFSISRNLYHKAAIKDPSSIYKLINALVSAGKKDEALYEASRALNLKIEDSRLLFACYAATYRFSTRKDWVLETRSRLLESCRNNPEGSLWKARLYRVEQNLEAALAELHNGLLACPRDPTLLRERASVALYLGRWGRDANAFLEARLALDGSTELLTKIEDVAGLLRECGTSLETAASDPAAYDHIRSPESVFDVALRPSLQTNGQRRDGGIVIVAHSLTAGGAERVIASILRRLREDVRFPWVKLYVFDLSPDLGANFYLPLSGFSASEAILLDRNCEISPPFAYLPPDHGRTAQAIFNQLQKDQPTILHASLEPLTVFAGFAAVVSGVPRIVLHTHNMRPTALNPESPLPPRLRGCYRALLNRAEVSLVGCAAAAVDDYARWLGIGDRKNLHVVHNGFNSEEVLPVTDREAVQTMREALGFKLDNTLIGTAFKFRDEKRPFRWVDAAAQVLGKRSDCRFVMFGDGDLLEPTREYINKQGLGSYFALPGLVSDLYARLRMLDLFVLSSNTEALPNVLLEAQAAGVPVVAYDVGGVSETMSEGETGLLVAEDSAEALASTVLRAVDNPDWLRSASKRGMRFVKENFSFGKMMEDLSEIMLRRSLPGTDADLDPRVS